MYHSVYGMELCPKTKRWVRVRMCGYCQEVVEICTLDVGVVCHI